MGPSGEPDTDVASGVPEVVRVFVGCAGNGEDIESQAVLEYSLRKHASLPVEIYWMRLSKDPESPWYSDGKRGWQTQQWSTPFSGFRWAVPELCGFQGRAIYTDSDTIWLADVAELWRQEFQRGKVIMAKGGRDSWRFCVSLWECELAAAYVKPLELLKSDPRAHATMVRRFGTGTFLQPFAGNWNCVDGENYASLDDPDIKVLHYSSEAHQPQLKHALPRLRAAGRRHWFDGTIKPHWRADVQDLFDRMLSEAEAAGFKREKYLPDRPFGPYNKKSHARGYRSHRFAPA